MRKYFLSFAMLWSIHLLACDICGSSGSSILGVFPNNQLSFIGLKYRYSSSKTIHPSVLTSANDYFQSIELTGRLVPIKQIQLFVIMPFQITKREEDYKVNHVLGLADVTLMGNYIFTNQDDSVQNRTTYFIALGGGVKLPTGKNNIIQNRNTLPQGIQLGTGSTDFIVNTAITLRFLKWGITNEINYRINTSNAKLYLNGNRFVISSRAYFPIKIQLFELIPQAGIDIEHAEIDYKNHLPVEHTGGMVYLANAEMNAYFKSISFGMKIQQPIYQSVNDGYTNSGARFTGQFNYYF